MPENDPSAIPARDVAVVYWNALPADIRIPPGPDDDPLIPATGSSRVSRRLAVGHDAVLSATESLSHVIGDVAARMARSLDESSPVATGQPGGWQPEAVDVTFGVQLGLGVDALFVAKGEASAEVSMRFVRSAGGPS